jgi:flagellar basal body rod protein FlgB
MNAQVLIMDNITELLVKIISFTKTLRKVLTDNINNMHNAGFVPRDLPVNEFSQLLDYAIDEHTQNHRLVLYDTENIKFGKGGNFKVRSMIDKYAKNLLDKNPAEYLALQINKLLENALNQKVAEKLIKTICETNIATAERNLLP